MDEILKQLGDLLLGSIPTIILFLILFVSYRVIVHTPLERILSERHDKSEGAVEKARADIAAAEAKTAEYEKALRDARMALFKAQEARRQKALEIKTTLVMEARTSAEGRVQDAKAALEKEVAAAKLGLQTESERLATEVIHRLFKEVGAAQSPATGGSR